MSSVESISNFAKSAIGRQPKTINTLQFNQFRFILHRTPETIYFCQSVKFPGINMEALIQPAPYATPILRTPNKLTFDDLELSFLVSEDFKNWLEIYDWIHHIVPVRHFSGQYQERKEKGFDEPVRYSDASLVLLNSASKGFIEIVFTNCFPLTLGGIDFSSTVTDSNPVTSSVKFGFSGYTINTKV
jgi:hypothetical protein